MKHVSVILATSALIIGFAGDNQIRNATEAKAKASSYAATFGRDVRTAATRVDVLNDWGIEQWNVTFQKGYGVEVRLDATTGRVSYFRDNDTMVRRRLAGPVTVFRLATRASAAAHLDALAKRYGVPVGWKRIYLDFYLDNTPGRGDSNRTGVAYAVYQPTPGGYPHFNFGRSMRLAVDPADGKLIQYEYCDHTITGPVDIRVSTDKARKLAEAIHSRQLIVRRLSHKAIGAPKLGWAVPMGNFESKIPAQWTAPFHARLAYKVPFQASEVYIDASTGESLGGDAYKVPPPPPPKRKRA